MSSGAEARKSSGLDVFIWLLVTILVVAAIGGNYYFAGYSLLYRVLGVVVALVAAVALALQTHKGKDFDRLRKEAWVEVRKVVWPSRQETIQTTMIVVGVVVVVALVLWAVDSLLGLAVKLLVG